MYGLPMSTFLVAVFLPIFIVVVLFIWGMIYKVEED